MPAILTPQLFAGDSASTTMKAIMSVAVMTPFFFIGFDVIPQAAEEINVPLKKIGMIMILSIVLAVCILCADHLRCWLCYESI